MRSSPKSGRWSNTRRLGVVVALSLVDTGAAAVARPPPLPVSIESSSSLSRNIRESTTEAEEERRAAERKLRPDFDAWAETHRKLYESDAEREKRFQIWLDNHYRILEKNEKHGPCKLTGKAVFGSNHLQDLTPEEFQGQYLTGYSGPKADQLPKQHQDVARSDELRYEWDSSNDAAGGGPRRMMRTADISEKARDHARNREARRFDSRVDVERHPSVQERYMKQFESNSYGSTPSCKWYNFSCWLKWIFGSYGYGGTAEPTSNSYPDSIDWREKGVVTDVHSQGSCGACWGITAVETVESAYAIKSGSLLDLAETEVIVCDDTCEMCSGGWPQNAYEYIADHKGLLAEGSLTYDGDWLYALTMILEGQSDEYNYYDVQDYFTQVCPSGRSEGGGGNSGSGSGSGDNANANYLYGDYQRYGAVKGYAYSTDRCLCYTDGSGCDCDEQDEGTALRNVASYGPATVCLDASVWQDYAGGILTSESGCSAAFLDMNHCVQTVGYAFISDDGEEEGGNKEGSGSGSNSHSGSRDNAQREGYWIIRNQWSSNWGMSGYIYVAMGENTCGVLNDMTQAFTN